MEAKSSKLSMAKIGKPNTNFPIVGIGASAGGLEALEQFLFSALQHPMNFWKLSEIIQLVHRPFLTSLILCV